MRVIPNDRRDFAYTVRHLRVERGGSLRVKLTDGTVTVLTVQDDTVLAEPLHRIYQTGTTATGLTTVDRRATDWATRQLSVPYSETDLSLVTGPRVQAGGVYLTANGVYVQA